MKTFAAFARRITRGYVALACALILLVVLVTTVLAFMLFAGTLDDVVAATAQRASDIALEGHAAHRSASHVAQSIAGTLGHGRVSLIVFDASHRVLAGHPQPRSFGSALLQPLASLFGVHRQLVPFFGGTIVVEPNPSRFLSLLAWYWSIVLPVGLVAVVVAWFAGRALTRRALEPLENVTAALRRIAGGDFEPEPLANGGSDLSALTSAYNDVAYRLTAATTQHREDEARMRQFIADAGHELRTPLTVIMGYLDMLRLGAVRDDDALARIRETMREESQRMRAVIEKLILLARLDRPLSQPFVPVDVASVVARAAHALAPLAGGRISVEAMPDSIVRADEPELYEAIKNVIDNALRYAPKSPVAVTVTRDGRNVDVSVRDDGPGIDAAELPHVFERFYRGSSRYSTEGSGLGLAIARRAVERVGGKIAVSSGGRGTLVTIRIPLDSDRKEDVA